MKKLDRYQQKIIQSWIEKNLFETDNPRNTGKPLQGAMKEYWRYRIGSYRIIARIEDTELILFFIDIAHRKEIYK